MSFDDKYKQTHPAIVVWNNFKAGSAMTTAATKIAVDLTDRIAVKEFMKSLAQRCSDYAKPNTNEAVLQLVTTLVLLAALASAMLAFVDTAYWLTLLLAIPAGGLVVRLFIIQHDCGHGSFFGSRTANDACGRFVSLFTMTPYSLWKREHAHHHAGSGNLERRGVGDIDTLTVKEYAALSLLGRAWYRLYRNPLFLFGFGIPFYFLVLQRQPFWHGIGARDGWKSVLGLDLAMAVFYGALAYLFGVAQLFMVVVPIVFVASAAGGWLFFIQHQFEGTYWAHDKEWDFQTAAVLGSSYYVLPKIVNWFTGHIGLHHIHHLNSRIPNYRLRACIDGVPEFQTLNRLTIGESLACVRLKLWDEDNHRLVGFSQAA